MESQQNYEIVDNRQLFPVSPVCYETIYKGNERWTAQCTSIISKVLKNFNFSFGVCIHVEMWFADEKN